MPDPALETEHRTNMTSRVLALADYAGAFVIEHPAALDAAREGLIRALSLGFETLRDPQRAPLIGPIVPGALMPGGARVPGTSLELEPAQAAFCISLMLCPASADHSLVPTRDRAANPLGGILATADYQARKASMEGKPPPKVRDLLAAMLKVLEIQGALAALDEEHEPGTAPLRLVRVAVSAVAAAQLGGTVAQIARAVGYACIDGEMLAHRGARDTMERAGWATADTIGRAVRHACQATAHGRPSGLTPDDLEIVRLAGTLLGTGPAFAGTPFGTALIDRFAGASRLQEHAQLTGRFQAAVDRHFPARQAVRIKALFAAPEQLDDVPVNELIAALVTNGAV
ncbi:MAG TPA: MmgE/PrpD family protein [Steroidobacteraceae bacterium]|nr:MmgE/PrpD family protein [Steroidobacteraceae bacterium]